MIKPTGKETRSFEIRASQDEDYVLVGYAATFNTPSNLIAGFFTETILPGAFDKALASGRDVIFSNQHNFAEPLARLKNSSLQLSVDSKGLKFRAQLDKESPLHQTVWRAVSTVLVAECSFGFMTASVVDQWSPDNTKRTLLEVELIEIAVVTIPAYAGTTASARAEATAGPNTAGLAKLAEIDADYERQRRAIAAGAIINAPAPVAKAELRGNPEFMAARCADALAKRDSNPLDYCGHNEDVCYGSDPKDANEDRCYRFAYDCDTQGNVNLDEDSCEECIYTTTHEARSNKRLYQSMRSAAGRFS
jgi:uncharacterized protein